MRFSDYFDLTAERHADAVAIVEGEARLTFSAVKEMMHAAGNALVHDPSVKAGAHVAIYSHNQYWVPILSLAISRADMASIAVQVRSSIDANSQVLSFMDCDVMFFHSAYEKEVTELKARVPNISRYICIDGDSVHGPSLECWLEEFNKPYVSGMEDPDAVASLRPTGGTTGPSKGVVHTNRTSEITLVNALQNMPEMEAEARYLAVAPLSHASGAMAAMTLIAGGCVVVSNNTHPDELLRAIEQYRITTMFLPPTLLYMVMASPLIGDVDLSSLKVIRVGAAPISPEKFKMAVKIFGPVLHEAFGQTECSIGMTEKGPEDYLNEDGSFNEAVLPSMGKPSSYLRMEIMDPEGNILPVGEKGEIVVQTSMVMAGYYKNPEETAATIKDGWLHTGDVGIKDEQGYVTLVDRLKDMIISGGFNVYPAQIEAVIQGHESVLDCIVVGVPDEKWGEAVKAVVQLKPGCECTDEALMAMCRDSLGAVYTPKSVEFRTALPRSPAGKLLRREVRAEYWADQERAL
ncbi:AMP-binding protein [Maricurvus nonylphenolicus]|uniref:class I adenylate-forming enzyme family protein n=1 Tax=Maricurvus nonylphenolicus TaxID=1008307 RepID=UPI0036F41350